MITKSMYMLCVQIFKFDEKLGGFGPWYSVERREILENDLVSMK